MGCSLAACGSSDNAPTSDGGPPADAAPPNDAAADTGADADASSNVLGFTPSNFDPAQLDFTGLGDIDLAAPGCCIGSDGGGFRCGDSTKAKYTLITQPN